MNQDKLTQKINEIIESLSGRIDHLECDGATRVLDYLLTKEKIEHTVMVGRAYIDEPVPYVHFWIEIGDMKLDLKSKMWYGEAAAQGFFKESDVIYIGEKIIMNTQKLVYDILMNPHAH